MGACVGDCCGYEVGGRAHDPVAQVSGFECAVAVEEVDADGGGCGGHLADGVGLGDAIGVKVADEGSSRGIETFIDTAADGARNRWTWDGWNSGSWETSGGGGHGSHAVASQTGLAGAD